MLKHLKRASGVLAGFAISVLEFSMCKHHAIFGGKRYDYTSSYSSFQEAENKFQAKCV